MSFSKWDYTGANMNVNSIFITIREICHPDNNNNIPSNELP